MKKIKLKYEFAVRRVAGENVALQIGTGDGEYDTMLTLNDTGAAMLDYLNGEERTEEEMAAMLMEKYNITKETATVATETFLKQLNDNGLLAN